MHLQNSVLTPTESPTVGRFSVRGIGRGVVRALEIPVPLWVRRLAMLAVVTAALMLLAGERYAFRSVPGSVALIRTDRLTGSAVWIVPEFQR